ncbi:nucleotide-diphospho-sugar transferase [Mycena floridula]|nr:nucleotide-diphospho-sugar transferase [Mycena floridula]
MVIPTPALRRPRLFLVGIILMVAFVSWMLPPPQLSNISISLPKLPQLKFPISILPDDENQNLDESPPIEYYAMNSSHPKAVIFMLLPPSRVQQAIKALQNVEGRFNRCIRESPDAVLRNNIFKVEGEQEEFLEVDRKRIEWITEGRATFAAIPHSQWDVPGTLDPDLVGASVNEIGFSRGYRAMCRFYSGFFWKHPALASYDWFWRLDSDIEFHCDVPYDPVQHVVDANAKYGFIQVSYDTEVVQPTLASNVSAYLASINNFEISHRSIWESELYTQFFDFLDRAGGFLYERWCDTLIHSFGIAMLLRKDEVVEFKDTGYQHQGWEYHCPADSALCTCVPEPQFKDFKDDGKG